MSIVCWAALVIATPAADPAPELDHSANPVYLEALKGVVLSAKDKVPLPESYMKDGLTAEQQKKILEGLCVGPNPKKPLFRYDDVTTPGLGAPYYFDQREVKTSNPGEPAWLIEGWFVAQGDLKALVKKDPEKLFAASQGNGTAGPIDPDDLAERKISLDLKPPLRERYVHSTANLIDRVEIGMTNRLVGSATEESIVVAGLVDQRFAKDDKFGNWWRILPDDGGKPGPHQTLEGGGYYVKATRLHEPKDALFVEFHQVNTEPRAWFNGAPILRSKINLWVREEVKRFRLTARKTLP